VYLALDGDADLQSRYTDVRTLPRAALRRIDRATQTRYSQSFRCLRRGPGSLQQHLPTPNRSDVNQAVSYAALGRSGAVPAACGAGRLGTGTQPT
jgi:hypothetical protein